MKKITDTTVLVTTTCLSTNISEVENKISNTRNLVTTTVLNTKISEVQNKIYDQDKYVTAPQFKKLTAEDFAARIEQANLVNKTDFDSKIISFNKRITSNKGKILCVKKILNSLIIKMFFFSQVQFILQVMMDLKMMDLFINQHLVAQN